jgi:regulatory protein
MKITHIQIQAKNKDRVNVSVDGEYRFSLDLFQIIELGINVGNNYSESELTEIENESQFGKLYSRALEYALLRPHSKREIENYLWRKTRPARYKARDGQIKDRPGVSKIIADRVLTRLIEKGHVDDEKFARFWVENRHRSKGISRRKLMTELRQKGIEQSIIENVFNESVRSDENELPKLILKKQGRYENEQKLIAYLARQGFSYEDIKAALSASRDQD